MAYQVIGTRNILGDALSQTIDKFGDIFPELLEMRRQSQEEEDFVNQQQGEYTRMLNGLRGNTDLKTTLVQRGAINSEDEFDSFIDGKISSVNNLQSSEQVMPEMFSSLSELTQLGRDALGDDWLIRAGTRYGIEGTEDIIADKEMTAMNDQYMNKYDNAQTPEEQETVMREILSKPDLYQSHSAYWNRRFGEFDQAKLLADEEAKRAERQEMFGNYSGTMESVVNSANSSSQVYNRVFKDTGDETAAQVAVRAYYDRKSDEIAKRAAAGDDADTALSDALAGTVNKAEASNILEDTITKLNEQYDEALAVSKGDGDEAEKQRALIQSKALKAAIGRAIEAQRQVELGTYGQIEGAEEIVDVAQFESRQEAIEEGRGVLEEAGEPAKAGFIGKLDILGINPFAQNQSEINEDFIADINDKLEAANSDLMAVIEDGDVVYYDIKTGEKLNRDEYLTNTPGYGVDRFNQYRVGGGNLIETGGADGGGAASIIDRY